MVACFLLTVLIATGRAPGTAGRRVLNQSLSHSDRVAQPLRPSVSSASVTKTKPYLKVLSMKRSCVPAHSRYAEPWPTPRLWPRREAGGWRPARGWLGPQANWAPMLLCSFGGRGPGQQGPNLLFQQSRREMGMHLAHSRHTAQKPCCPGFRNSVSTGSIQSPSHSGSLRTCSVTTVGQAQG